jgi:hypothetical protein
MTTPTYNSEGAQRPSHARGAGSEAGARARAGWGDRRGEAPRADE